MLEHVRREGRRDDRAPRNDRDQNDRRDQPERDRPEPLATERIEVDGKIYFLDLLENNRGQYVKITEKYGNRRNTIVVASENRQEFVDALLRLP